MHLQNKALTMKAPKEFYIPFVGLKEGKHQYHYKIDNLFFEAFDYKEFNNADVHVVAILHKNSNSLSFTFKSKGIVNVFCDISNEAYDQEIEGVLDLIVKYGETYNNENDEILIIPHGEHQINVAQYIYEMIVLSIPAKKVHPGIEDGTLSSDILEKLAALHPKAHKKDQENDPRWDVLKNLLTE